MSAAPVVFLDLDDVVVLRRPVEFDKHHLDQLPADVCAALIHPPAGQVLTILVTDLTVRIVLTSNWCRFTSQSAFQRLLDLGGYPHLSEALHEAWSAPRAAPADTRLDVIDTWLTANRRGEPYVVIDDQESGSSLVGSPHDLAGRVLICPPGGLHLGHLPFLVSALR